MTTKRKYTARDIEDLTRLTLQDALDALKKKRDDDGFTKKITEVCNHHKELVRAAIVASLSNSCISIHENYCPTVRVILNGVMYKKAYFPCTGRHGFAKASGHESHGLQLNLDTAKSKEAKALAAALKEQLELEAKVEKINKQIQDLEAKLEKVKDLAARFRLGLTGDETDLDSINHKIRQYLLGEKSKV